MDTYLQILRDTPLPTILVIGGIVFLLLTVLQKAGTSIETKPSKERFSVITGVVLLLSGISLYLVPPTPDVSVAETPAPVISITETIPPADIAQVEATTTQITSNPTATSCAGATVLGPWEHINGLGQDVTIESGDGYVHAVFWRPGGPQLKVGYDEVSVLIEPHNKITFVNVAGTAFRYHSSCSKEYVEEQIKRLNNEKIQNGGTITTVTVSELESK
jgi:hypothetical protein